MSWKGLPEFSCKFLKNMKMNKKDFSMFHPILMGVFSLTVKTNVLEQENTDIITIMYYYYYDNIGK